MKKLDPEAEAGDSAQQPHVPDGEAALLVDLAGQRLLDRLPRLHVAAGQTPRALRPEAVPLEQDPALIVEDHAGDGDQEGGLRHTEDPPAEAGAEQVPEGGEDDEQPPPQRRPLTPGAAHLGAISAAVCTRRTAMVIRPMPPMPASWIGTWHPSRRVKPVSSTRPPPTRRLRPPGEVGSREARGRGAGPGRACAA